SEMLLAPMSIGVCTGNLNLTKAIAAHAVNISAWDDTFMPASCWAGWHHDCAHLDLLKECGFFINRVSSFNKNPLDYAVMRCARDIVRSLKADEISRFIKQEVKSAVMDLKHERAKGIFNVLGLNFNGKKETFEHICGLGASIDTFVYGITANTARASDIDSILKAVFFEAKARLAQAG
ncbi:MAG TPA: hypothetical protein PKJ42_09440, partial [Candidatus Goldiibacteriota bacterium]|nr:hypothetical protein [Candidatus Goldiibacteriota bacterium]